MKHLTKSGEIIRTISNPLLKLKKIQDAIEKNAEIHFGVRSGLLSDNLLEAVAGDISKFYGSLSIESIDSAFDRFVLKKEDWRNLTKAEILNPIKLWWNQNEAVNYEFQKFEYEQLQAERDKLTAVEFKDKSIEIYRESVKAGKWLGDMFNASVIAKDYLAAQIDQSIKDALWIEAGRAKKEAEFIAKENIGGLKTLTPEMMGVDKLRIYSELIVKKAIELKIEI